jgi:hypothetical protein
MTAPTMPTTQDQPDYTAAHSDIVALLEAARRS